MGNRKRHPASFRDPSGHVYLERNTVFRQINRIYESQYNRLMSSGLYRNLVDINLLIPHEEIAPGEDVSSDCYTVIKPEPIPFISYPYEWSFSQLKAAALTTLAVQKIALSHGMSLKDASAYNIQFKDGNAVLIDTLSFEEYREGYPWVAYRQFCQHFLAPLALMSFRDIRVGGLLRNHVDGIPMDLASRLLPFSSRARPSLLAHIHLHARSNLHFGDKTIRVEKGMVSGPALRGILDSLESTVRKLKLRTGATEWSGYYQNTNYSEESRRDKERVVGEMLDATGSSRVIDLGANTGEFSRLASARGIFTVSVDCDPLAVEMNYLRSREEDDRNLLPLLVDLTNPSPGIGWGNEERMSWHERSSTSDTVMALALIHHLAIANNLPLAVLADYFSRICTFLIIEFVSREDSQVQGMLATRENIFSGFNREAFEGEFSRRFTVLKASALAGSRRTVYLMKRLNGSP